MNYDDIWDQDNTITMTLPISTVGSWMRLGMIISDNGYIGSTMGYNSEIIYGRMFNPKASSYTEFSTPLRGNGWFLFISNII